MMLTLHLPKGNGIPSNADNVTGKSSCKEQLKLVQEKQQLEMFFFLLIITLKC